MRPADLVRGAVGEVRAHPARSALTCVSLSVGVAAAFYTLGRIAEMEAHFERVTLLSGPGRIVVEAKQDAKTKGLSRGLTLGDAEALRARLPEAHMVYPRAVRWNIPLRHGAYKADGLTVLGTTEQWRLRDWVYRTRGRFLSSRDVREAARVVVLVEAGGWVKKPFWAKWFPETDLEKLLKRRDLLGAWVLLDGRPFRVVGILKEPPRDKDRRWFRVWSRGGLAVVPSTALGLYLPRGARAPDAVDEIHVDTGDAAAAPAALAEIKRLLKARHRGEDDFTARDFREIMAGALASTRKFLASIAVIGLIAVLAGGIGILNVTIATVYSRVREIGVRRALGATQGDIVAQFVGEAALLGLVSGVLGVLIGLAAMFWLAPEREELLAALSPAHAAACVLVAAAVGVVFSAAPAWRASRLDPVEALRYE